MVNDQAMPTDLFDHRLPRRASSEKGFRQAAVHGKKMPRRPGRRGCCSENLAISACSLCRLHHVRKTRRLFTVRFRAFETLFCRLAGQELAPLRQRFLS